jgi:hypothetical protein
MDNLTSEMCNILQGTGAVVNMDNYYMSTTAAIHLKEKGILCRGTIRTNRKFVPKSVLFMAKECRSNERGTSRIAVNAEHSLVAIGWLDNKAVNFISTADTTDVVSVERRIKNEKVQLSAPAVIKNYNMYMGGVDRHDKLCSTFSLGKHHKFKKYFVKFMLFIINIALTNSWIYYKLTNPTKCKKSEARADFFLSIAEHLVRPGYDWAAKYKVTPDSTDNNNSYDYYPRAQSRVDECTEVMQEMEKAGAENKCKFVDFSSLPLQLKKRSKTCQVCNYEMQKPKWKGVVMCMNHGVWLCSGITQPRCDSSPVLYKATGEKVTDYSWTCPTKTSCWNKFHEFYELQGLFARKVMNLAEGTICFGSVLYSSELYQQKYKALGIEVTDNNNKRKTCMGRINLSTHIGKKYLKWKY